MSKPDYSQPDLTLLGEDHIRAYRDSGGEVGYLWNGVPTLLLTSTGRRTGAERTSALIFATTSAGMPAGRQAGVAPPQARHADDVAPEIVGALAAQGLPPGRAEQISLC